jgi:ribosomal protein L11 methyltransferase
MQVTWAEVSCKAPAEVVDELAEFLVALSGNGVCVENLAVDTFSVDTIADSPIKTVKGYFIADAALHDNVAAIDAYLSEKAAACPGFVHHPPTVTYLQEEDWANNWKQYFKPSRVGRRMVIKPTWEEFAATDDDIILELDPGQAFGTGTHPTTRLCLETLENIFSHEPPFHTPPLPEPAGLLDVGTGSGILAIAAAKFGAGRVVATDIDPKAVSVAQQNLAMNGVQERVAVSAAPLREVAGTFEVVVANILAEELVRLAPELVEKITGEGFLVLSGILTEKEDIVLEGFARFPLVLLDTRRDKEWSCITYRLAR